jgi:SAM-dependent methyltransferase
MRPTSYGVALRAEAIVNETTRDPEPVPRVHRESLAETLKRNLHAAPQRELALARYAELASAYDSTCRRIQTIRCTAIDALALTSGETVVDVACGTGATLLALAERVGPNGHVIGIELCPEMAAIAAHRVVAAGVSDHVRIIVAAAEDAQVGMPTDAYLFCYTHDVLQSPAALRSLFGWARPAARVAVAGAVFLPWWYGFAPNMVLAYRGRRYLTTYQGLRRPWRLLEHRCPDFRLIRRFHWGTSFCGIGTVHRS